MAHTIISTQPGSGPGGSAKITIEYTPSHDVLPAEQIRRIEWAERKVQKINHGLYGAEPYPDGE